MGNAWKKLQRLTSVRRVVGLIPSGSATIDFVFFICPRMKAGGYWLNKDRTGLETKYVPGLNISTRERVKRVETFVAEARKFGLAGFSVSAIISDADALVLFSVPVSPAPPPSEREVGFPVYANYEAVRRNLPIWEAFCRSETWLQGVTREAVVRERKRLKELVIQFPAPVVEDFVKRVFAGFALDGLLLRRGELGPKNPVILGVESPGVALLQNAALPQGEQVPVVELR